MKGDLDYTLSHGNRNYRVVVMKDQGQIKRLTHVQLYIYDEVGDEVWHNRYASVVKATKAAETWAKTRQS